MNAAASLKRRKKELRGRMRALRDIIPPEERRRKSEAIEERLFQLPGMAGATTVMCFSSFGSEASTAGIIERLASEGRRVALPRIVEGEIEAAAFHPGDPVVVARFGAAEPRDAPSISAEEMDVVITPGLAFDRSGYRVGYGGGYFDRFLPRTRPGALRVGVCFAVQVVDGVPHGPSDAAMDVIVTESETITCRPHVPAGDGGT